MDAPFPPLIAGEAALQKAPRASDALRKHMADVYGVDEACVLPVAGAARGVEIAKRLDAQAQVAATPSRDGEPSTSSAAFVASEIEVIDESLIEFSDVKSSAELAARTPGLVVIRSLEWAYGLAGAPCAALIAAPELIARLAEVADALPTPTVRLAESVLDPSRARATQRRIDEVKAERARLAAALGVAPSVTKAVAADGPFVVVMPNYPDVLRSELRKFNVPGDRKSVV